MNQDRRSRLREAITMLAGAARIVDAALDQEEDALDSVQEYFADTDRAEKMEEAVARLSDASEAIGQALEALRESIS